MELFCPDNFKICKSKKMVIPIDFILPQYKVLSNHTKYLAICPYFARFFLLGGTYPIAVTLFIAF
jgi:hypothetical protein